MFGKRQPEIRDIVVNVHNAADGIGDVQRVDMLMRAADMHLKRAIALAETEWKVSLLFWGAMLTSGISFISFAGRSEPPMADYIAHSDWLFFLGFVLAGAVFLFGFSINQSTSIREERAQYQSCQNEAASIAQVASRARTGLQFPDPNEPIRWVSFLHNRVWVTKLFTTYSFISGVWFASQWLAHGKTSLAGLAGSAARIQPNPACAFFNCGNDNQVNPGDLPEIGTVLWAVPMIGVVYLFVRTFSHGGR